jgi:putative transposase
VIIRRNRTPSKYIYYGLYFYFSGLSLRRASKILSSYFIKRNHVSIWNWIQKYNPKKLSSKRKKISEFVIDETLIKVGSEYIWLWVAVEPKNREILALSISKERNICFCCRTLFINRYQRLWKTSCINRWRHLVSTTSL